MNSSGPVLGEDLQDVGSGRVVPATKSPTVSGGAVELLDLVVGLGHALRQGMKKVEL